MCVCVCLCVCEGGGGGGGGNRCICPLNDRQATSPLLTRAGLLELKIESGSSIARNEGRLKLVVPQTNAIQRALQRDDFHQVQYVCGSTVPCKYCTLGNGVSSI